jgi:hypothetical protein
LELEAGDNHDDTALLSGHNEQDTTDASKRLCNLLSASTMGQMLEAARNGMQLLHSKRREVGSVT